jgi:8-oxo-dGTP pyrophosphatase MutT (NUDIX family)
MTREALEETGVLVKSEDLSVVHTVHQIGDKEYIDFYLQANKWNGDPSILEPDKCDDIQWFSLNELPDKLLPNVKDVLKQLENGQTFSEFKWK